MIKISKEIPNEIRLRRSKSSEGKRNKDSKGNPITEQYIAENF